MEEIIEKIFYIAGIFIFITLVVFAWIYFFQNKKLSKPKKQLTNNVYDYDNEFAHNELNDRINENRELRDRYQKLQIKYDNLFKENQSLNELLIRYEKTNIEDLRITENRNNIKDEINKEEDLQLNQKKGNFSLNNLENETGYSITQHPKESTEHLSNSNSNIPKNNEYKEKHFDEQILVSINLVKKDGSIKTRIDGNYKLIKNIDSHLFELIPIGQLIGSSTFLSEITPVYDIINPNDANYKPLQILNNPKYLYNASTGEGKLYTKGQVRYQ